MEAKQDQTVKEAKPEVGAKAEAKSTGKTGRNPDGTFAPGNTIGVNVGGGRPTEELSFRHQMKIRAAKDPNLVQGVIDNLIAIANNPDHPKCVEAAEKLIKLNGNYDPAETKAEVTSNLGAELKTSPLSQLTRKDLLKLLKRDK